MTMTADSSTSTYTRDYPVVLTDEAREFNALHTTTDAQELIPTMTLTDTQLLAAYAEKVYSPRPGDEVTSATNDQIMLALLIAERDELLTEVVKVRDQIGRELADRNRAEAGERSAAARADRSEENHQADVAKIGAALLEAAERRDWCSEYDDLVDAVNRQLHCELPTRVAEYTVTYTVTVTIEAARDESDARSQAGDAMYNARNSISESFNYDFEGAELSD